MEVGSWKWGSYTTCNKFLSFEWDFNEARYKQHYNNRGMAENFQGQLNKRMKIFYSKEDFHVKIKKILKTF